MAKQRIEQREQGEGQKREQARQELDGPEGFIVPADFPGTAKHFAELESHAHSHSIVAGGLLVISYTTRLIPSTSLTMRLATLASSSLGRRAQSAVMKS